MKLTTWFELTPDGREELLQAMREAANAKPPVFLDREGDFRAFQAAAVLLARGVVVPIDALTPFWEELTGRASDVVALYDECRYVIEPCDEARCRQRADVIAELYGDP